ncbi:MAG: HAD-IIIA family hydrolase [Acidiferrobacterales bacterium]
MKLVILSRDGVINKPLVDGVMQPDEWLPMTGSLEAIARLQRENYKVVVATAQEGVAREAPRMETLNRIHVRMLELVRNKGGQIDCIFICPHAADEKCSCRPPRPGLYQQIAERLKTNLSSVYAACASRDEVAAVRSAGARPVLIGGASKDGAEKLPVYANLADFVEASITGKIDC